MNDNDLLRHRWRPVVVVDTAQARIRPVSHLRPAAAQNLYIPVPLLTAFSASNLLMSGDLTNQEPTEAQPAYVW